MKKLILILAAISMVILLASSVYAINICLVSSGGLTFNLDFNQTTGNATGTYTGGASGPAFMTLNTTGRGFTITWLTPDGSGCSGIYQGVANTPFPISASFLNDCGSSGTRTISLCTAAAPEVDTSDDQ